ncbi:MAG: restriction endonuclease [Rhizobiaceae bacterium]|nr:restriction endonuclease [Rhizobiaceae bacterium]
MMPLAVGLLEVEQKPIQIRADDLAGMQFRYIKFGPNGAWAARAIEERALFLGHKEVPHELAMSLDRENIAAHLRARGKTPGKASDFAREILDFHSLGPDTVWITFHNGRLYWTIAEAQVRWLGEDAPYGARRRETMFAWRDTDFAGKVLVQEELSSLLTRVSAYRQTICSIANADYLRRKLAGQDDPDIEAARDALGALSDTAARLIGKLHQDDFETLVGLLFERQGYHRISRLGGTMKDIDMVVEQPFTQEKILVQVKSRATQAVIDDYVERFEVRPDFSRMVFAVHSPTVDISAKGRANVEIWDGPRLAQAVVRAGLIEWLMARAA